MIKRFNDSKRDLSNRTEQSLPDDGRNVAPLLGRLTGEAASMEATDGVGAMRGLPEETRSAMAASEQPGYYGIPLLKRPVWKWFIPAYFFTGGLAGGSAWVALCAQVIDPKGLSRTVRRARSIAIVSLGGSAVLLIADLGRPARFINMLRVFRPTSPMNLGTWILSTAGMVNGATWLLEERDWAPKLARAFGLLGGGIGLLLSGYTAVLVTNTAVPVWKSAHRSLPLLFIASGLASTSALFELFPLDERERRTIRPLAIVAKAAELAAESLVSWEINREGRRVAEPLRKGVSGALFQAARWLTAASLAGSIASRRSVQGRITAGALGTVGALALRFAILYAGRASADAVLATTEPQRRQRDARTSRLAEDAAERASVGRPTLPRSRAST